jgi:pimeloyl-ACP methyl ester carboxylesterase
MKQIKVAKFPVQPVDWLGYHKYEFTAEGTNYCIVVPNTPALGKPWIWRAEFFGHEPQVDLALLEKGWHLVYIPDAAGLYGSPSAVQIWNKAYDYLTSCYEFAVKPVLEGFSRGGLLVYNWAAGNQNKVACIYADAPVCAIQSWPGGKGKGVGSPEDWQLCLKTYGITEEQAIDYNLNPIDRLKPLVDANVPLLHVCGDSDEIVPMEENTLVLKQRYESLGGRMQLITKQNCGHHPHSLEDPKPIVEFIFKFNH